MEAWPGAGLIALRSGAPVIPLAITGSQRLSLPKMFLRPFPRQHVTMTFGEPFTLQKPARDQRRGCESGDAADHGAHRRAIAARVQGLLWKQPYAGRRQQRADGTGE